MGRRQMSVPSGAKHVSNAPSELAPVTRECGHDISEKGDGSKRCTHVVTPGTSRCAARHPVRWDAPVSKRPIAQAVALPTLQSVLGLDELIVTPPGEDSVPTESAKPAWKPTKVSKETLVARRARIQATLPKRVITVDLDGNIYDPWACCKRSDGSQTGSEKCRHVRMDTVEKLKAMAAELDAALVVLSWRSGADEERTRQWLPSTGLEFAAVFIPDTTDDILVTPDVEPPVKDQEPFGSFAYGQAEFKVKTVMALRRLGVDVVASFDDSDRVCEALTKAGVKNVVHTPHLVKILKHERTAGYIGAPVPPPGEERSSRTSGGLSLLEAKLQQLPFGSRSRRKERRDEGRRDIRTFGEIVDDLVFAGEEFPDDEIDVSEIFDDPDLPPMTADDFYRAFGYDGDQTDGQW